MYLYIYEDYYNFLFNQEKMIHTMTRILQENHQLYTAIVCKTTLSPYNDKKYIFDDLTTLSFGHYKI